jgi:hypothetical protein
MVKMVWTIILTIVLSICGWEGLKYIVGSALTKTRKKRRGRSQARRRRYDEAFFAEVNKDPYAKV